MSLHPASSPSVVTPGNHDGVHLGHRALITAARKTAAAHGWQTKGMCFDPHPTSVLAPERAPALITSMTRRVAIMKDAGCDDVIVLPFDRAFAQTSPREFVESVLVEACGAKGVVVGPDFHFGHRRSGNVDTLRELGEVYHFFVTVVPPVIYEQDAVSSTRIRRLLCEAGDVNTVNHMMRRVHDISGVVVKGNQRGRTLGFPTANLDVSQGQHKHTHTHARTEMLLPKDGVYAVVARRLDNSDAGSNAGSVDSPRLFGVANLGQRPTFDAGRSVEVHLFDVDEDFYGAQMRVGFVARLRGEKRFAGVDALVTQIQQDCDAAREALRQVSEDGLTWF